MKNERRKGTNKNNRWMKKWKTESSQREEEQFTENEMRENSEHGAREVNIKYDDGGGNDGEMWLGLEKGWSKNRKKVK